MHKKGIYPSIAYTLSNIVRIAAIAVVFFAIAPLASHANAQTEPPPSSAQTNQTPSANNSEPQTNSTQEFHLSRERYEKAVAYSRAGYVLYFVSVAWSITVLLLLLYARFVARLRDFVQRHTANWILQGAIFAPLLFIALGVAQLPVEIYWHSLSLKYQQSIQGWGSWLWDWAKGEMVTIVFGLVAVLILFAVIRRAPTRWWLYFWFGSIPLVLSLILIAPWVLDPMFHKFLPLQQSYPQLVASIQELTERAGEPIPPQRMFLMVASAKSNQINAYVTGVGASKRVVVWDNTINKLTPGEVLFVVGHETGHYVLGHVVKGILFALAMIFAGLWLAYHALHWVLRRWGPTWNLRDQSDWAALAALLLIASVLGFLAEPVGNGFSRGIEHAADVFGIEVIHGIVPNPQETAAQAFQVMGESDLADPNPSRFITFWLYSHPPLADRLKFARNYDPWAHGQSPKYVK